MADMVGVLKSDAVILMYTNDLCGAYIEVGLAIGRGLRVYLVGQKRWTIFWALPNVVSVDNVQELYTALEYDRSTEVR